MFSPLSDSDYLPDGGGENMPYIPRPDTANKLLKMTWRLYNKEGRANQERGLL